MTSSPNQHDKNNPFFDGAGDTSVLDIKIFLKKTWKIMILSSFLGLAGAVAYIVFTPNRFEATAQIRLAQISQINPANPFGTALEDPGALISRMQFPTNYSSEVTSACGYQDKPHAALRLSKDVKLSIPKGVVNTVELGVLAHSPDLAEACVQAIFGQIVQIQERLSRAFVDEAKLKLAADDERIESAKKLIAKADTSGVAMSAAYLAARDELTYFLNDREKMLDLINSVKSRGTRLDSPIYVSDQPAAPKKILSMIVGLAAGFFLGLVFALGRKFLQE